MPPDTLPPHHVEPRDHFSCTADRGWARRIDVDTVSTTARRAGRPIAGSSALLDGDDHFDRLSAANSARFQAEQDEERARRLRAQADDARRRKDFLTVADAYTRIDREVPGVELRASERGRLKFAQKTLTEHTEPGRGR